MQRHEPWLDGVGMNTSMLGVNPPGLDVSLQGTFDAGSSDGVDGRPSREFCSAPLRRWSRRASAGLEKQAI